MKHLPQAETRWDRWSIKAAIHRRGASLTDVALAAGLEESACRVALIRGYPKAERVIAEFLGVAAKDLWPDRYRNRRRRRRASKPAAAMGASRNDVAA